MRPCKCDRCYVCWKWFHDADWRVLCGGPSEILNIPGSVLPHGPDSIIRTGAPVALPSRVISGVATALPVVARPNRCEYLQKRTEFKAGCNGWRCRHTCEKGLPAVPGEYCQTCDQYQDSGEKF